jgi:hypothetical protein
VLAIVRAAGGIAVAEVVLVRKGGQMKKLLVIASLVGIATLATADRDVTRAGTQGTVTAYQEDGRTVIENKPCFKTTRHGGYDYVRCGQRLRDAVKLELCRTKGSGLHTWFYQIGDNRPTRSTVHCRRY